MKVSELRYWLDRLPSHVDVLVRNADGELKPVERLEKLESPGTFGTSSVILELTKAENAQRRTA
jgi:hypothetical protein